MSLRQTIAVTLSLVLAIPVASAHAQTPSPALQCVRSLCGDEKYLLNAAGGGDFRRFQSADIKALFYGDIVPDIVKIQALEVAEAREFLSLWDHLTNDQLNTLTPAQTALANITGLSFVSEDLWDRIEKWNQNKYVIDRDSWARLEPQRPRSQIDYLADISELIDNSDIMEYSSTVRTMSFDLLTWNLQKTTPDLIKQWASDTLDAANFRRAQLGRWAVPDSDLAVISKARLTATLNSVERHQFVNLYANLAAMDASLDSPDALALLSKHSPSVESLRALFGKPVESLRHAVNSPELLSALRARSQEECRVRVNSYMNASPSALASRHALQLGESVKAAAMASLPAYLSGADIVAARAAIQKTSFTLPEDMNSARDILIARFDSGLSDVNADATSVLTADASGKISFMLFYLARMVAGENSVGRSLFNHTWHTCEDVVPPILTDRAWGADSRVLLSWQSVMWPQFGAGIMAHEIGHVVKAAVEASGALNSSLACKQKEHEKFYGASSGTLHDEEDWADTFSVSVLKQLDKTWPYAKNFACAMLSMNPDTGHFADDALDATTEFGESHSSSIFRLLQVEVALGHTLPPSCRALGPHQATAPISSCSKN